jgi:hypothetical protein
MTEKRAGAVITIDTKNLLRDLEYLSIATYRIGS